MKVIQVTIDSASADKSAQTANGFATIDTGNGVVSLLLEIYPRKNYSGLNVRLNRKRQATRELLIKNHIRSVDMVIGLRKAAVKAAREFFNGTAGAN